MPREKGREQDNKPKSNTLNTLDVKASIINIITRLESIEEKVEKIANDGVSLNFKEINNCFDALKDQIDNIKKLLQDCPKKADVKELFYGNDTDFGLNNIADMLDFDDINTDLAAIKSKIGNVLTKSDAEEALAKNDVKSYLKDILNQINNAADGIKERLNYLIDGLGSYNKISSKISDEINKNTTRIINTMHDKFSYEIKATISSTLKENLSDKMNIEPNRCHFSKNTIVTVISVVVLMLSAIFMSLGFAVRYANGLPLALSWSAMAFLCASLSWTIVLLVFRDTEFEEYMEDYILQFTIPFGVFLLTTFVLSLLSLVLL